MKMVVKVFLTYIFLLLTPAFTEAQKNYNVDSVRSEIREVLKSATRDSSNKSCEDLLTAFYQCFESDQGQANPEMLNAMVNLFSYKDDLSLPNRQIATLLYNYINSVSESEIALEWIKALKTEYASVYKKKHPLILLYEGESLINAGKIPAAHTHFLHFHKEFPNSVTALCYVYQTETDQNLAQSWLSILKKEHPNHWIVKKYK